MRRTQPTSRGDHKRPRPFPSTVFPPDPEIRILPTILEIIFFVHFSTLLVAEPFFPDPFTHDHDGLRPESADFQIEGFRAGGVVGWCEGVAAYGGEGYYVCVAEAVFFC